ncbi:hypothetical protein P691DRAFT_813123 [Macrolepiota fuliginosa MF-IS2]|uniref:F-box domain-containing protein n=1 Tax=Macrolepiota fuliginosa MF-IS2 TaxID=1400762 RepID=A0A9P5XCX3_9AGAR|nr:hypothetical protein P691DRAFT_813123 [Macrolepiota fuliginosa MF-IS2]
MQQLQISIERSPLITKQEFDDIFQGKIVHKLNVPDLPVELWMEILSYLPRGFVWKMAGINRFLFEMGMSELYEEVRLMDYSGAGLKTFEQMRHGNITPRVRRLYVRPTFLPGVDCKGRAVYDGTKTSTGLKRWKREIRKFLDTALTSLTNCPNLQEVTIIVHDQYFTKSLARFLQKLMKQVAAGLNGLTIDMTLPSFLRVYRAFDAKLLSKLSSLTIRITNSRFPISVRQARWTRKALLHLISPLKATLRSLAFEVIDFSLSKLFQNLQNIPSLQSLELRSEIGFSTLIPTLHFIKFLQRNADNLQRLVVRRPTVDIPNSWSLEAIIGRLYDLLCSQRLPQLKELSLEVDHAVILTSLTTHIHTFVPHLRRLTLTGQRSTLDYPQLSDLMKSLARCDKGLEHLKISIKQLSPSHIDLFANTFPKLKCLELTYRILWTSLDQVEKLRDTEQEASIYNLFRTHTYPQWRLEELKLMQISACAEGHPDAQLLNAIMEGLPSLRRVARVRTCECP